MLLLLLSLLLVFSANITLGVKIHRKAQCSEGELKMGNLDLFLLKDGSVSLNVFSWSHYK